MNCLATIPLSVAACCLPQDSDAVRLKEIKGELRAHGVRVASSYVALTSESELKVGLRKVRGFRTRMMKAEKELASCEKLAERNRDLMTQLTAANADLNTRLAQVREGDVAANNKLVGMINANNSRRKLLDDERKKIVETLQRVRQSTNQSREDYNGHIIALRGVTDAVYEEYAKLADSAGIESLLSDLSKLTDRSYTLKPSRSFESSVRQLEKLEESVLSQSVKLRRDASRFFVSVVVNGKAREMVVDAGSSHIGLPWDVAKELGVKIKPSDKALRIKLKDGRQISGTLVTLDSVRVGGFVVDKVEAAVLGPEAKTATPLLGMSYLKHFRFEVKANEATLSLVRNDTGRTRTASKKTERQP